METKKTKKIIPYRRNPEFYFRVGVRYAGRKMFRTAARFLNKAYEKDPYNADYQFNLACVLAELKEVERSNEMFMNIIKNIDPTLSECYFGIACNYFDAGNFKKAYEYFEKYLVYDREGEFLEEAYDILYYLQIYTDAGLDTKKEKAFKRLAIEGRKLLDQGSYIKAVEKLEKAIEIDPEAVSQRNDLSISRFLAGEAEKAISIAKSVLKLEERNLLAHCNLALFYSGAGKKELYKKQIKSLLALETPDVNAFIQDMKQFLKNMLQYRTVDENLKRDIIRILEGKKTEIENQVKDTGCTDEIANFKRKKKLMNKINKENQ